MGEKSRDVRIDQTFNNEFDLLGEYAVQRQIQASLYQGEKLRAAENWLAARAYGPQLALAREGNELAREAKLLARSSKRAARFANFIALVALIIAATAVAKVDPAITAWFKSIFPHLPNWG